MAVSRVYCGGEGYKVTGVGYEPQGEFFIGDRAINPEQESEELIETLKAGYMCNNASLAENRDVLQ
jgi:Ca2+-transporting ATPase